MKIIRIIRNESQKMIDVERAIEQHDILGHPFTTRMELSY